MRYVFFLIGSFFLFTSTAIAERYDALEATALYIEELVLADLAGGIVTVKVVCCVPKDDGKGYHVRDAHGSDMGGDGKKAADAALKACTDQGGFEQDEGKTCAETKAANEAGEEEEEGKDSTP